MANITEIHMSFWPAQMATLYMNDGVTALRLIFHLPRINPATGALIFTNRALVLFVLPYFALMISTFGTVELHMMPLHHSQSCI